MADATLSEITDRILQKLYVLPAGETAEATDSVLVQDVIVSVNEELRDDELCYWSDAAFPKSIKEAFCDYICCRLTGDYPTEKNLAKYGGEQNRISYKRVLAGLCESRERIDRPTKADYY